MADFQMDLWKQEDIGVTLRMWKGKCQQAQQSSKFASGTNTFYVIHKDNLLLTILY